MPTHLVINMCQSRVDDRELTLEDTFVYVIPGAHLSTSYCKSAYIMDFPSYQLLVVSPFEKRFIFS